MVSGALDDDLIVVFYIPPVMFECCFALVVAEFGDGEEVFTLHVREDVGLACGGG